MYMYIISYQYFNLPYLLWRQLIEFNTSAFPSRILDFCILSRDDTFLEHFPEDLEVEKEIGTSNYQIYSILAFHDEIFFQLLQYFMKTLSSRDQVVMKCFMATVILYSSLHQCHVHVCCSLSNLLVCIHKTAITAHHHFHCKYCSWLLYIYWHHHFTCILQLYIYIFFSFILPSYFICHKHKELLPFISEFFPLWQFYCNSGFKFSSFLFCLYAPALNNERAELNQCPTVWQSLT